MEESVLRGVRKILFVVPLPPPVHGAAMVSKMIMDSVENHKDFSCDFVNISTSRSLNEIGKSGICKIGRFISSLSRTFYLLVTRRYDLCCVALTCHGTGFLKDAPFVALCKMFCKRVVLHQHNKGMAADVDRWPYRWLLPAIYRNTQIILLSERLYPDIQKVVLEDQVVVCPNGVNECFPYMEKESHDAVTHILFLSNLLVSKGVYTLLDACKSLKEDGMEFICEFVGGETSEVNAETLSAAISERGLTGCVFYSGPRYGSDKEESWNVSDIFVLPSANECFPLVIVEAMQHSVPVVATEEGGIPDLVIDGVNGLVCSVNDSSSLASALKKMVTNPEMRHAMGKAGRRIYEEEYTVSAFEKRFWDIMKDIVNG